MLNLLETRGHELYQRLGEHLLLAGTATVIAVAIGIVLAVLALRSPRLRDTILGLASIVQTIPSLALLTFLLPLLGIGVAPAIVALTLYALLPIVRNTYTGLREAPPDMLEMADAQGLSRHQRLAWIEARYALPYLLAGIRTAAVVSVGVATLSAFIGAGGLGVFINRGLAMNNTQLVLFGAIPAALLALFVDATLAVVEGLSRPTLRRKPQYIRASTLLAFGVLAVGTLQHYAVRPHLSQTAGLPTLVVGSKNFTEQLILGHMLAILLEENQVARVERRLNMAGTAVCHQALLDGSIDLYVEYTGTAITSILKQSAPSDAAAAWNLVAAEYPKRYSLSWLPKLGFANTYALAVREADADRNGWTAISDLKGDAPKLRGGFTSEFLERPDGYPGLAGTYGIAMRSTVDMDPGLMYDAVRTGKVDVVSAFSTDGRITAFNLRLLEDDRHFFPPYDAAIIVRQDSMRQTPNAAAVLGRLSDRLTEQTMQRLNLAVDRDKRPPSTVAREFLLSEKLIRSE